MTRVVLAVVVVGSMLLAACPAGQGITYVNRTGLDVRVLQGEQPGFPEEYGFLMASGQEVRISGLGWSPYIRVTTSNGEILFEQHVTWEEVEARKRRITIRADGIEALPAPNRSP
jgi:hypothetical protein